MKRTIDEHADRFDAKADEYDDSKGPDYHRCRDRVVELADPTPEDTVLDIGTGTGAIALSLASAAKTVIGRDISEGMLEQARSKANEREIDNVSFDTGRFLEPNYDGSVDILTSNFAMHHLSDEQKVEAIAMLLDRFEPRRFVLGDVMLFDEPDPAEPFFNPDVDDPATVGRLVEAFTQPDYVVATVESIHDQVGVIAAEHV